MLQRILSLTYYNIFYHRFVMMYFIADLLWSVFMSSTVSFSVSFYIHNLNDKI